MSKEKPSTPPAAPAKILVIDDEEAIRELLREVLVTDGYTVLTAADGREALPMALSKKPDLILSDVRMPKLDGLTLCKALRVNPETKNIPVVMLTGYNVKEHMEAAISAGADDFLSKPINIEEVRIRVRTLLKLKNVTDEFQRLQQYVAAIREQSGKPHPGNKPPGGE
jgi:two-component system cell cycle response regulator